MCDEKLATAEMNVLGYERLADVLRRAFDQAARGKGKERHAVDHAFHDQPMQTISELIGSADGLLYQAIKKTQESRRLPLERSVAERLGAIVYLAGSIIFDEANSAEAAPGLGEIVIMEDR